ncbi:MAG: hypothetical protein ACE361_04825 [Aureliella sp.]
MMKMSRISHSNPIRVVALQTLRSISTDSGTPRSVIWGTALFLGMLVPTLVYAQVEYSAPEDVEESVKSVASLAGELGSKSFRARESATFKLISLGEAALPTLKSVRSTEPEVSRRLQSVIATIEASKFERLADEFLTGSSSSSTNTFPGYAAYQSLVGESRVSKLLFMEMYRQQPELVQLVEQSKGQSDPAANQKLVDLVIELSTEVNLKRLEQGIRPEIGDVLAFLLATSVIDRTAPIEVSRMLELSSYSQPVTTYLRRQGYADVIKRMYGEWIPKTQADMSERALRLAVRFQQASGIDIARRCVANSLSLSTRELALQMIALYGNEQDLGLLQPLLKDKSICRRFSGRSLPVAFQEAIFEADEAPPLSGDKKDPVIKKPRPQSEVQYFYRVCDLALASVLMLTASDTEEVFPKFTPDPYYAFDVRSISLVANEESVERRDAALQLWAEKLAKSESLKVPEAQSDPASNSDG